MSEQALDPQVVAMIDDAKLFVVSTEDGAGMLIGDSETQLRVRHEGNEYSVERISRGANRGLRLVTSEKEALDRFLATWIGPTWRAGHHLGAIHATRFQPERLAGYQVVEDGERRFAVVWPRGNRQCRAGSLRRGDATELALTLSFTLDEVIASYKDPDGRPVYPQKGEPPMRVWRR